MYLELAEGSNLALRSLVSKADDAADFDYLLIPDPAGKRPPIFVSAKLIRQIPESGRKSLYRFSADWNRPDQIATVEKNVNKLQFADNGEGTDWSEVVETVVEVVDTVSDWFDGGDGSGSGTPADPGTIVSATGFVAVAGNINGKVIGFGVHPQKRQMIAFSSPQKMAIMFPNLPPNYGSPSLPFIPLPPLPPGALSFSLSHPDQVIRQKAGGGWEVVPNAGVAGYDNNGNPLIYPPPPPDVDPAGSGSGVGSLLPLAAIALLLTK